MNKDMSSLIEQAAHRMAQLREAGVDLPETPARVQPSRSSVSSPPEPHPAVLSRRVEIDLAALAAAGCGSPRWN